MERDLHERDGSGDRNFLRLPTEPHQEICCVGRDSVGRPTVPAKVDDSSFVQTSRDNLHGRLRICDVLFVGCSVEENKKCGQKANG